MTCTRRRTRRTRGSIQQHNIYSMPQFSIARSFQLTGGITMKTDHIVSAVDYKKHFNASNVRTAYLSPDYCTYTLNRAALSRRRTSAIARLTMTRRNIFTNTNKFSGSAASSFTVWQAASSSNLFSTFIHAAAVRTLSWHVRACVYATGANAEASA
jgi:hypothetical protein